MGRPLGGLLVSMLAVEHPSFVSAVVVVDPGFGLADVARSGLTRLIARMQLHGGYSAALEIMAGLEAPSTPHRWWCGTGDASSQHRWTSSQPRLMHDHGRKADVPTALAALYE